MLEIGQKVRIVKICAPFLDITYLGKVDIICSLNPVIFLENLKINVNPNWIEVVSNDSINSEIEVDISNIYKIKYISNE